MTDAYSDLDITIEGSKESQEATLSFIDADPASGVRLEPGGQKIEVDFQGLRQELFSFDPTRYGNRLRDNVFKPQKLQRVFTTALAARPLRIRLRLRTDDPELLAVRWELMTDFDDATLSTRNGFAFSRFPTSERPARLRSKTKQLRALVAVVNPTEQERQKFGLAEIETNFDKRAKALGAIHCDGLTEDQDQGPVTMNRLMAALQAAERGRASYDILYLVCHGHLPKSGEPQLLFALDTPAELANKANFRSGARLAKRMVEGLVDLPRLVVLASCAGAGTGAGDALAATGPLLAGIGVPAVMAMQGFIKIDTVEALLPRFFAEFEETGAVDRAMQAARRHVRDDQAAMDWWAPVLFMRLENGELVYDEPGSVPQSGQTAQPGATPDDSTQRILDEAGAGSEPAQVAKPVPLNLSGFDRVKLYRSMSGSLNKEELIELTYIMGVNYEDLAGSGLSAKIRELITYCQRRGKIELLLDTLAGTYSERDWYTDAGVR